MTEDDDDPDTDGTTNPRVGDGYGVYDGRPGTRRPGGVLARPPPRYRAQPPPAQYGAQPDAYAYPPPRARGRRPKMPSAATASASPQMPRTAARGLRRRRGLRAVHTGAAPVVQSRFRPPPPPPQFRGSSDRRRRWRRRSRGQPARPHDARRLLGVAAPAPAPPRGRGRGAAGRAAAAGDKRASRGPTRTGTRWLCGGPAERMRAAAGACRRGGRMGRRRGVRDGAAFRRRWPSAKPPRGFARTGALFSSAVCRARAGRRSIGGRGPTCGGGRLSRAWTSAALGATRETPDLPQDGRTRWARPGRPRACRRRRCVTQALGPAERVAPRCAP